MDTTKLHGMAEAVLSAIKDENYPAAKDLIIALFQVLEKAGHGGGYKIDWNETIESENPNIQIVYNNLESIEEMMEDGDYKDAKREIDMANAYSRLAIAQELQGIRIALSSVV